jgi:Planctomycete cytochrome C
MSKVIRPPGLARVVLLGAVCLLPPAFAIFGPVSSMAAYRPGQDYGVQDPAVQDVPLVDPFGQDPGMDETTPRRGSRAKALRKRLRPAEKEAAKKADSATKKKSASTAADSGSGSPLKFSQDIAPILVANCTGCHSGTGRGLRQGKLDLSTFEKLQKRTPRIFIPGRPEESKIVLRVRGDETPQMPLGNNRTLADEAIAKIEQWIKQGAKLDSGVAPGATLESYAASPDQVRRSQLAKQPVSERDKKVEEVGLARWKLAGAKSKPEVVPGEHFVLFSNLPRERAASVLKPMETQYSHLKRLLGSPSMDWVEKVSLIVLSNRTQFIEFVRSEDKRDPEAYESSNAHLNVPQPYVVAVDPLGGRKDEPTLRRKARSKQDADDEEPGNDRTLLGLLTEGLGTGAVAAAGDAPRWLAKGIGTYLAFHVEPRSPFYRHLRQSALANFEQGWLTRANEALGDSDQLPAGELHAISFALVEAMMGSDGRAKFPVFVGRMLNGKAKLDDVLAKVYEGTREDFLNDTGEWVARNYGNNQ